jgi:hypothetical protein
VIADPAIALRARHPWESIDLGALMLRRWAGVVAALVAPIAVAAAIAVILMPGDWRVFAIIAIWWLKPLVDRLAIVPVGVLLFAPRSKPREIAGPLLRSLGPGLLADLSWRRFSPRRAYLLAARTFEGTRGSDRRRRNRELLEDSRGWIAAIAAIFLVVEWVVAGVASVQLGGLLDSQSLSVGKPGYLAVLGAAYALVVALIEPLYALSCFSLYLNRRTIAEGWDLELRFKRLAARQRRQKLLSIVVLLVAVIGRQQLVAAASARPADSDFSKRVESTLEDPVFGAQPRTVRRLALRDDIFRGKLESEKAKESLPPGLFAWLSSEVLRVVVGIAVLALIVVAVAANRGNIARFVSRASFLRGAPQAGGPDLDAPSPEAELAEALRAAALLWGEDEARGALGLLYRASIDHGTRSLAWKIGADSTEGDCLREASRAGGDFSSAFAELASAWSRLAWGARPPNDEEFRGMLKRIALAEEARP